MQYTELAWATMPTILSERVLLNHPDILIVSDREKEWLRSTIPYYQTRSPANWERLFLQRELEFLLKNVSPTMRQWKFQKFLNMEMGNIWRWSESVATGLAKVPDRVSHYFSKMDILGLGLDDYESVVLTAYARWLHRFTDQARSFPNLPAPRVVQMYSHRKGELGGYLRNYLWRTTLCPGKRIRDLEYPVRDETGQEIEFADPGDVQKEVEIKLLYETICLPALLQLPQTTQKVIQFRINGKSWKDIAARTGLEVHAAEMRYLRGLRELRATVGAMP